MTFEADITNFKRKVKEQGFSFTMAMVYAVCRCANQIEAFRYRFLDGQIVLFDCIDTAFTYLNPETEVNVPMIEGIKEYVELATKTAQGQKEYFTGPLGNDVFPFMGQIETYKDKMIIREYQSGDCKELAELFYNTIHTVNAKDYRQEQLDTWVTGKVDLEQWDRTLKEHYSIVVVEDEIIVGFGDIDKTGYLDRLFVHKDHQRKGVATAICDKLEQAVQGRF